MRVSEDFIGRVRRALHRFAVSISIQKGHRICDGPIIPIFESLLPEEVISDLCIISE